VTFRGRDIFQIRVPRSGIKYGLLFECMEAAHWRGLSDEAFAALIPFEQARVIAHYRAHHQLEAVLAQQQQRDAEARSKKTKGR
jgi:hypothetical protein